MDVINRSCLNFHGDVTKSPLQLGHVAETTSTFTWMCLLFSYLIRFLVQLIAVSERDPLSHLCEDNDHYW